MIGNAVMDMADGHEEREGREPDSCGGELPVKQRGRHQAEGHRHQHRHRADPPRGNQLLAGAVRETQLGSDDEHEQHEADLREAVERGQARRLEDLRVPRGKERPEHDWAEHDAGRHLADHGRLPEAPEHQAEQPGGSQDQHQLQQQRGVRHSGGLQAAESNSMRAASSPGEPSSSESTRPASSPGCSRRGRSDDLAGELVATAGPCVGYAP